MRSLMIWAVFMLPLPLSAGDVLPDTLKMSPRSAVTVNAATDKPVSFYAPDPGLVVIPDSNGKTIHLIAFERPGTFRVVAFVDAGDARPSGPHICTVTVGQPKPPPDDDPVDPDDPVKPSHYYFVLVRPDGPASEAFEAVMRMREWGDLQKSGHKVKDFTVTEATKLNIRVPTGTRLPLVITLSEGESVSKVVRGPIPLPTTGAAILKLTEGLKNE